jgi:hypothetical protein
LIFPILLSILFSLLRSPISRSFWMHAEQHLVLPKKTFLKWKILVI